MSDFLPAEILRARSDADARERVRDSLNLSLSAVHGGQWWYLPRGDGRWVAKTTPEVLDLHDDDGPIYLRSTLTFSMEDDARPDHAGGRKVRTEDYAHTISRGDSLKPGLYSFEWAAGAAHYPHVHLHRGNKDAQGLGKLHIPTGRVFFEHVLLFLHSEHGVPLARPDGMDVLMGALQKTMRWASWGGGSAPTTTA